MADGRSEPAFRPRKSQNWLSFGRSSPVVWLKLMTRERSMPWTPRAAVAARRHHRTRPPVWPLRRLPDHGAAAQRWLGGERRRCLHDRAFAGPARIFGANRAQHAQRRRNTIERLAHILADAMHGSVAGGTRRRRRLDHALTARQMLRQSSDVALGLLARLLRRLGGSFGIAGHASDAMLSRYVRDGELFVDNASGALL